MAVNVPGLAAGGDVPRWPPFGRQVDGMVRKGYLERSTTSGGELTLGVTQRGQLVADAVRQARSRLRRPSASGSRRTGWTRPERF